MLDSSTPALNARAPITTSSSINVISLEDTPSSVVLPDTIDVYESVGKFVIDSVGIIVESGISEGFSDGSLVGFAVGRSDGNVLG